MSFQVVFLTFVIVTSFSLLVYMTINQQIEQRINVKNAFIAILLGNAVVFGTFLLLNITPQDILFNIYTAISTEVAYWWAYQIFNYVLLFGFIGFLIKDHLDDLLASHNRRYLIAVGFLFIAALCTWLPFNFTDVADIEIWATQEYLSLGVPRQRLTAEIVQRPSIIFFSPLAVLISPNTFHGSHWIILTLFALRGILIFAILKKLGVADGLSFGIAFLAMFYPSSETVLMSTRMLILHTSLVTWLLAVYIFLIYRQNPKRLTLIAFLIVMYINTTTNQYGLLNTISFPLLLLALEKRFSWRWFNLSMLWCLIPFAYVFYTVLVLQSIPTHLGTEYFGEYGSLAEELSLTLETVQRTVFLHLYDNWYQIWRLPFDATYLMISIVLSGVGTGLLYFLDRRSNNNMFRYQTFFVLMVGIYFLVIATLFFGLIPSRRESDWRIHSFASVGSATTLITFLWLLLYRARALLIPVYFLLFSFAIYHTLHLHNIERTQVSGRTEYFWSIRDNFEDISSDAKLIILTDLGQEEFLELMPDFSNSQYRRAVAVELAIGKKRDFQVHFCGDFDGFRCRFYETRLIIQERYDYRIDGAIPIGKKGLPVRYEDAVFLRLQPDGSLVLAREFPQEYRSLEYVSDVYQPLQLVELKNE